MFVQVPGFSLKCILSRTMIPEHAGIEHTFTHSHVEEMLTENLPLAGNQGSKSELDREFIIESGRRLTPPDPHKDCPWHHC